MTTRARLGWKKHTGFYMDANEKDFLEGGSYLCFATRKRSGD